MIRTRQKTLTNSQRSSTSIFTSQSKTISMKKSITMNEAFNTFNTSIVETFESNYAVLQRELDQLNEKRRRVELLREMQKTRTIKIVEFSEIIFATSTNRNKIDDLQKKKLFKIVNFKKYKNITQHDLNIFIREYNKMFEIRRNIYANDKDKILFARSFLDVVSTKDWKRHQKTIDLSAISWFEFIDFLQKHLNLKHFRLLEINAKLKKIREINEQSIIDLIVYLNNLKMQISEKLSNYQKYLNLMKILHFYLKIAIIRRINAIMFKAELKKIVRLTKKTESISNHIKKIKKSYSIENIKQHRFQLYSQIDRIDADASQNAIQNNDRSDDRDKKNVRMMILRQSKRRRTLFRRRKFDVLIESIWLRVLFTKNVLLLWTKSLFLIFLCESNISSSCDWYTCSQQILSKDK
jgi:hypothetical protein